MYILKKLTEEYHQLSLWYFVSFIFGIIFFFYKIENLSPEESFFYIAIATAIISGVFFLIYKEKNLLIYFCSLCIFSFSYGIFASTLRTSYIDTKPINQTINGEITGEILQIKPSHLGLQLLLQNAQIEGKKLKKVRINISSKLIGEAEHGDTIRLKAKLFPLQSSVLPGTYDFGFYMYMSGVEATGYALSNAEIIAHKSDNFSQLIQNIRHKIYNRLIDVLGKDSGNFAAAILIGEIKAIPKEIADNTRNSGIAHILSVSGLHLSLVAMIFFISSRMVLNCSNYISYNANIKIISAIISIIGSFCYLQISGGNIAATRAFIMTFIFIIAIILGRSAYPIRSVFIAAFGILSFRPEYIFHPSFQLSFTAVLCLISGFEFYINNNFFSKYHKGILGTIRLYLFTNIYSSFLAGIVTAPFVIYHFYKFANYSIIMNLIAVPIMSFFMMPLSLFAVILMPLNLDFWILKLLGFFIQIVIDSAAYITSLPGAVLITGHISPISLLIFSFGFFWICLWRTKWRFFGIVIMIFASVLMYFTPKPDFIYDHTLKAVGIKNKEGELEIYSQKQLPQFTSDYWANWYGQESIKTNEYKISAKDHLFITPSGKLIGLSYWNCQNADLEIITSKKLQCKNAANIISNNELWKYKQILLYCGKNKKNCVVEYANDRQKYREF